MGEGRLVKRATMEVLSLRGGVKWLRNLELSLVDLGWRDVRLENVKEMSRAEVKCMLSNCAWREVNKLWAEELTDRPKLCVLKELVGRGFKARCACVGEEEENEKSADETERGYSGAAGGDGKV